MNNNKKNEFVVSLKNKANERIVCNLNGCTGTVFIGVGAGLFKCDKCGYVHHISNLDFCYWELAGLAKLPQKK